MDEALNTFTNARNIIGGYRYDDIEIAEGLYHNQYQVLRSIEFYTNSRYLGGQLDKLGREKPFYNVVNFRQNTSVKATEYDTKNLQLIPDGDYEVETMLFNHELHDWFKEVEYDETINKMVSKRAKYGHVLVKKVEKDGKLDIQVVDWRNIYTDPTDTLGGTIIEQHYMAPAKLRKMGFSKTKVEEAIKLATTKRDSIYDESDTDGTEKKVKIHEIYDMVEANDYNLRKTIVAGLEQGANIALFQEDIDEIPYKGLKWEDREGRGLGVGPVEDGFEAQVWSRKRHDGIRRKDYVPHR